MHQILESGFYTIRTLPTQQMIGRNMAEDSSFEPKGIFGQPRGVPITPRTTFFLQHISRDSYYIKCGSDRGHVVDLDGKIHAALSGYQRWAIRSQPQHGADVFTIESEDGYWSWIMPVSEPFYTPVIVRSLVASPTVPPLYLPDELWILERIG